MLDLILGQGKTKNTGDVTKTNAESRSELDVISSVCCNYYHYCYYEIYLISCWEKQIKMLLVAQ